VHQARGGVALGDGHVQGVQDQLGPQVGGHRPAHDRPREGIEDHREIEPAFVGALLGDVGHPEPVRRWWGEGALDQIRRGDGARVTAGQAPAAATVNAHQAVLAHQPGHALAADPDLQPESELSLDAWGAVGAPAARMDATDLLGQDRVCLPAR